jgi:ubiquinone/menaquinone biosynthesis C-methylase UbiE
MEHKMIPMSEYLGYDSLQDTARKRNFNNWLYQQIFPGIKGDILEVGSGIGTYSEKIIRDFPQSQIALSDISDKYVKNLQEKFNKKNILFFKLDLDCSSDYEKIGFEKFDTIIAVNVLDNVKNDEFALLQLYKMLKKDGMLLLLLPAHKFLYNQLDTNIGRLRRYSRGELESKIKKTDFKIVKLFHFNLMGTIGWYLNGKSGENPSLSDSAFRIFDSIIPVSKAIEKITCKRFGLSVICYLKK